MHSYCAGQMTGCYQRSRLPCPYQQEWFSLCPLLSASLLLHLSKDSWSLWLSLTSVQWNPEHESSNLASPSPDGEQPHPPVWRRTIRTDQTFHLLLSFIRTLQTFPDWKHCWLHVWLYLISIPALPIEYIFQFDRGRSWQWSSLPRVSRPVCGKQNWILRMRIWLQGMEEPEVLAKLHPEPLWGRITLAVISPAS